MVIVEDLVVDYALAGGAHRAVDRVSLDVAHGEFFTLLGPSGCGKTSILRAIAGLERPSSGRIGMAGQDVFNAARGIDVSAHRRDVSMVFQSYAIWPHLTVAGNVAFPLEIAGVRGAERAERLQRALELVGLSGQVDRLATNLSGGQQQRVAIARGIIRSSPLILLDEPLSNLDAKLREQMRVELRDLLKGVGISAVYVTHDQEEALALSDRIAVMNAGRIVEIGAPRALYLTPKTRFAAAFLGQAELFAVTGRPQGGSINTEIGPVAVAAAPPQQKADFVLARPEAMVLHPAGAVGENRFAGRLIRSIFSGRHEICVIELAGGRRISVLAPPYARLADGCELTVELPRDRLALVTDDDGCEVAQS